MASPILLLLDKPGTEGLAQIFRKHSLSFMFQTWGMATIQDHKSYSMNE